MTFPTGNASRLPSRGRELPGGEVYHTPAVRVYETDEAFHLVAELPGVPRDRIKLKTYGRKLTITGTQPQTDTGSGKYVVKQIGGEHYYRTFQLSDAVELDGITAGVQDGELTVHLPKNPDVKPKRIIIE